MNDYRSVTEARDSISESKPRIKVSWMTRFFWWCSGAVIEVLEEQPTEKNKYFGMGAAIFGTWILATASGVFAFYTMFKHYWLALPLGIFYGAIIFNLDRFITSSMKKEGSELDLLFWYEKAGLFFRAEVIPAIPRILIAIIIGFAIAKPLELKIFQKEIQQQLELEKEKDLNELRNSLSRFHSEIIAIEEQISTLQEFTLIEREEMNRLRKAYYDEMDGTGGSGIPGFNKRAKAKYREFIKAEKRFLATEKENNEKIETLNGETIAVQQQIKAEEADFEIQLERVGFLEEIKALESLISKPGNKALWWSNFFIIAIILLIETAPILIKLISARGPYDAQLDLINRSQMIDADRKLRKMKFPQS